MNKAKKIAVVRTDRIGDMILTMPMCAALKNLYPQTEINLIARSYVKPLLENCPAIDSVFYIDDYSKGIKEIFEKNKFDAVFFPRPRFNECLAAFIAGIPLRVGTAYRWYSVLFNHKVHDHRKTAERHEAEYNTRLVASASGSDCPVNLVKPYINPESREKIQKLLSDNGISKTDKYIIIHPGSGGSAFEWNAPNFGHLADKIQKELNSKIVVTGSEAESEKCSEVQKYCAELLNLCGKTDLREMIALISLSKLFISNSTGTIHIAAALDIPTIGLYPNSPHISAKRWGPYSKGAVTVSPTEGDDMNLITVEQVFAEVFKNHFS